MKSKNPIENSSNPIKELDRISNELVSSFEGLTKPSVDYILRKIQKEVHSRLTVI